jgi:hypothetical protein
VLSISYTVHPAVRIGHLACLMASLGFYPAKPGLAAVGPVILAAVLTVTALAVSWYDDTACDRLRALDVAAAVSGVAWGLSASAAPRKLLCALELSVLVALCGADKALHSGGDHLTWWGVSALAVLDALTLVDMQRSFVDIQALAAVVVALGTAALSAARCGLLHDTFESMGPGMFIAGNLAIHYYPVTRGLLSVGARRPSSAAAAAVLAIAVAYSAVVDPDAVYECGIGSVPSKLVAPAIAGAMLVAIWKTTAA